MAKSILAMIGDASIDFVDLIRFILRLERRTMLMDQLRLCSLQGNPMFIRRFLQDRKS